MTRHFPAGLFVAISLALTVGTVACHWPEATPPTLPALDAGHVPDDAATCLVDQGADDCGRAGNRLRVLDCRADGRRLWCSPAGLPFAAVCRDAARDGRDWHPACLAHLPSCDLQDRVFRGEVCP